MLRVEGLGVSQGRLCTRESWMVESYTLSYVRTNERTVVSTYLHNYQIRADSGGKAAKPRKTAYTGAKNAEQ